MYAFLSPSSFLSHAVLEDSDIEDCAILSLPDERTCVTSGSLVHRSILQHGVHVSGHALVKDCLLMEHSHVEQEGKVRSPNTIIRPMVDNWDMIFC